VVVVGAGPVGLAAILTAKLYGPGRIVAVDLADSRLESARQLGADETVNSSSGSPVEQITEMTDGLGADVVMEAVGVPETFELCTELVRPGGRVANIGVHGYPVALHLETLWIKSVTIATGLVDASSTSTLLKLVSEGRLDTTPLATHRFALGEIGEAYDTFADPASTKALKVVLSA
jgi:alcohol dehydrogenase